MRMVALTYLSTIRFSDADAGDFLHNQLSGDVLGLANGDSTFACYCEPRGRVLALMLVCRLEGAYYVVMSTALVSTVVERLRIYVMRSKVDTEVLDEYPISGSQANKTPATASPPMVAIPLPDKSRWYMATAKDVMGAGDTALQNNWKTSELKQGIAWLHPETSGQFLPQMLGFDQLGAVNFRKGCYPGQEIVARTHYLGKVKQHPRMLNISATICPKALDTIQILSAGQEHKAIVVDCGQNEDDGACLFVVTRMDPDLTAEQIKYQDQILPLVN